MLNASLYPPWATRTAAAAAADLPIVDAQPYYASEKPLFTDGQYHDFLFRGSDGGFYHKTTHYKCAGGHDLPDCICAQWK